MRTFNLIIAASLVVGCASQPAAPPPVGPPSAAASARPAQAGASRGLAFDPPITAHVETTDLSRDGRGPTASNGVVQTSTSNYNVTTSIQDNTPDGNFNQSTVTQQTGTVSH
jgi:hypothetical protein